MRNTFIHVSGKPVENPPCGGSVKKLHRASKDSSEKLIMEPGGGSQCALRNRVQSDQGPEAQGHGQARFLLYRTPTPQTGEGPMATEEDSGYQKKAEANGIQVISEKAGMLRRSSPPPNKPERGRAKAWPVTSVRRSRGRHCIP